VQPRKAAGRANPRQRRHRRPPDDYDVWHWFARDPQACVANTSARRILRGLKHPLRPWFRFPTLEEIISARTAEERKRLEKERDDLIDRQHIPWWQHLREELLRVEVPVLLADSLTDYLSGYVMVRDREQAKSEKERINLVLWDRGYVLESSGEQKKGRVTAEWRRAKRLARALGFPPRSLSEIRFLKFVFCYPPFSQSGTPTFLLLQVCPRSDFCGSGRPVHALCGLHPDWKSFNRLCVAQIIFHSACTFSSPRSRNLRNPRASLICPKTGSTTALRIL